MTDASQKVHRIILKNIVERSILSTRFLAVLGVNENEVGSQEKGAKSPPSDDLRERISQVLPA